MTHPLTPSQLATYASNLNCNAMTKYQALETRLADAVKIRDYCDA